MLNNVQEHFATLFTRLFPKTHNIEIRVDASPDGDYVYVDAQILHAGGSYRITNLKSVPPRIKIGSKFVRISQKNRHTLRQLADWDPAFDVRKGFTFYEKDVPEILNYLHAKASVHIDERAERIAVDNRPLQYVHNVEETEQGITIATSLVDSDSRIKITQPTQVKFVEASKFVHAEDGYYRKPQQKEYKTFQAQIGPARLEGDQVPIFLLLDLKKMESDARAQISPQVKAQRVLTQPFEPNVSVNVDGPWIWLDVRYKTDRFELPFKRMEEVAPGQLFVREEESWIQVDRKTHALVSNQIDKIPEVEQVADQFRTPTRNFYEVQSLLERVAKIDPSAAYAKFIESLSDFSKIKERPLPSGFRGELRPYQKHGYDWLCFLSEYGLNGILADEMGLGKTVQALTTLLEAHSLPEAGTSLIVCPPSVLSAWGDDISRFTSAVDFRIARYVGGNRKRIIEQLGQYDALLTTYNIIVKDIDILRKIVWEYVVLDEAQKIKNPDTATAKACRQLIVKHKLALTGTPVENRLRELWSIFEFLMPSFLGNQTRFKSDYEIPIVKQGDRNATEKLKRRISPFKLRRLKAQVATELPEKINMDRYCELTPEQAQLYKQYALSEQQRIRNLPGNTVKMDTSILTAILRLKQICCHPALILHDYKNLYGRSGKTEAFVEILEELVESGEKALIFSQFVEMLQMLQGILNDRKAPYFYLNGSTPEKDRARMKTDFQKGAVPFFLISLRAGGLGMTLTEANCVVHYDRWWNPAVEDQATDRVHRIGQTRTVKVFRIHTVGTIEERIGQLLVKKKDLFDSVIEVDDLRKEVSKEELLALFAPPK